MKLTVKMNGTDALLKKFKSFGKEGESEVVAATEFHARGIEAEAKRLAPIDISTLAKGIVAEKASKKKWYIIATESYSAFLEFGTGGKAVIPAGWEKLASQFKGKKGGTFKEGLERVKGWCKRQGIDESAAYPIFISTLKNGINPHPFMYPAFKKGAREYKKDLKDSLEHLIKKYNKK